MKYCLIIKDIVQCNESINTLFVDRLSRVYQAQNSDIRKYMHKNKEILKLGFLFEVAGGLADCRILSQPSLCSEEIENPAYKLSSVAVECLEQEIAPGDVQVVVVAHKRGFLLFNYSMSN